MAEIKVYPVNGVDYDAEDVETYMATRTSGVWAGDLDYTCKVTGLDNNVTVSDGLAWMRMSSFSGKSVAHKGTTVLDAGLPDARLPRIDAVVLQYRAGDPTGKLLIKKGTPASDPQPPKVERSASLYELHLYHINRNVGATTITPDALVDLREDEKYCGIMYDDVTLKGTMGFLTQKDKGVAGGVAPLGEDKKVPGIYLPKMDYIPTSDKGAYNGVASLVNGKVPSGQLPSMNYIPISQKGLSDGVAPLNSNKYIDRKYLSPMTTNFDLQVVGSDFSITTKELNVAAVGKIFIVYGLVWIENKSSSKTTATVRVNFLDSFVNFESGIYARFNSYIFGPSSHGNAVAQVETESAKALTITIEGLRTSNSNGCSFWGALPMKVQ